VFGKAQLLVDANTMDSEEMKMKYEKNIWYYNDLVSPFNQSKILAHSEKLFELCNQPIVAPICCEIDLADGFCNNKCRHCFFGTNEKAIPVLLDTLRAKTLLVELKALGVKAIEFSGGGEPTTHPDIKEIITYCYNLGFDLGIVTNGYLLDRLEGCYHMFTFIRVSVDAASPETYAKVHGVNYFDKVIENLKKVKNGGNADRLGIGYLITGSNNEDIISAAQFFGQLGCRFLQYRPASMESIINEEIWKESKCLVEEACKYSTENFQIFNAGIKWNHVSGERHYNKCTTSCLVSVIKANGEVPMCVLKRNEKETCLGNIYDNTFEEIFFSKKHEEEISKNDINTCRKPCKHDSYNIMQEALCNSSLHINFV
jgi:MoaA/NifB/PqqE/SkfB family radical SAM enzyme